MPALWTYPWDLYAEGLSSSLGDIEQRGIDALNVAAHYHSVRSMCPRKPDRLFDQHPGGCYVPPDSPRFDETPVEPVRNQIDDIEDPIGDIVLEASSHGISTRAWVVCLHNTRLSTENPTYRTESAFGDTHDHSLCPSHPEVREYFAAVIDSVASRNVDEIQLESVGFPSAFHAHGEEFGHDKRHVLTTLSGEALLSQCFCDGCCKRAQTHSVDLEAARDRVQTIISERFRSPDADSRSLDQIVCEEGVIEDLFDFRRTVVQEFVATLASASGNIPLNYYVMEWPGYDPGDGVPAGVHLTDIDDHLDRMTALCYVSSPEAARARIRELRRAVSSPVDAGVTLNPNVIGDRKTFESIVDVIGEEGVGTFSVYHYGLLTTTHLDWVRDVFGE